MSVSKSLKIDERRKRILEILARDGKVKVSDLAEELNATPVTIRSDLANLRQNGYLERTSGGAVQTIKNFYNLESHHRRQEHIYEKKLIARRTTDLIRDGETLFINSGTTTYYTAVELKRRKNLNIVTNSLMAAMELGDVPSFRVILLGGEINTQYSFTYGASVLDQLRLYRADRTILSMDGISAVAGLTTYHADESVVNKTMIERSSETIIVADSSKIGNESFSFVAGISAATTLVTVCGGEEPAHLAELEKSGLQIIKCPIP
jgi:DeoR/GlpR family transcriptional regulator of sugar metabolism